MLWYEALIDITSAAGDPGGDELFERAKDHLIRAISAQMVSGQWGESDTPGYFQLKADVGFGSTDAEGQNYEDLSSLSVLKIDRLFPHPFAPSTADIYGQIIHFRTIDEIANVTRSTGYQPTDTELYVWRNGHRLYVHKSSGNAVVVPLTGDDQIYMRYLEYPDDSSWDDDATTGTELVGAKFSEPFINAAIQAAIQTLLAEDQQ